MSKILLENSNFCFYTIKNNLKNCITANKKILIQGWLKL